MGIIEDFASDFVRTFKLSESGEVTAAKADVADLGKYRDLVLLVGSAFESDIVSVFDAYHAVFMKICRVMGLKTCGFEKITNTFHLNFVDNMRDEFVNLHRKTFVTTPEGLGVNETVLDIFRKRAVPLLALTTEQPHDPDNVLSLYVSSNAVYNRITGPTGQALLGTHDGTFHCDEALAVFMLRQTSEYSDARVVRTRDASVLRTCNAVVDVGGVYDHEARRYDHHQNGFGATFSPKHATKLSSAGLVYLHYGKEIIKNLTQVDDDAVSVIYNRLYGAFIEAIDAIDNGIDLFPGRPLYSVQTDLSSRVGYLNPSWNSEISADAQFEKAVALTGKEFMEKLVWYATTWLPARELVRKGVDSRFEHDPLGRVVVLDAFTTWSGHLSSILSELNESHTVYFVVFPDRRDNTFRVRAVNSEGFKCYRYLPEKWRGLKPEELCTVSGIEGCTFVHANGFIGGNKTREGAIRMAYLALC